jgi:hypothetical protein
MRLTPAAVVVGSLVGAVLTTVITVSAYLWFPPFSARRALFVWAVVTVTATVLTAWIGHRRPRE